jgi:DNA repair protein RecO (recombination protein O)
MKLVRTKGIVLKEIETGDADKWVVVLTPQYGKLTVVAPGAKRARSKFVGCTQWLCYSDLDLFRSTDRYRLNDGNIIEPFYEIRNDLVKLTYATYFCEIISDLVMEDYPAKEEIRLFLNSLFFLSQGKKNEALIGAIFQFRILAIHGMAPYIKNCFCCHASLHKDTEIFFSFSKCAVLCKGCHENEKDGRVQKILLGTFMAFEHILKVKLEEIFKFEVSDKVLKEVVVLSQRFLEERLEKKYKSLEFLSKLTESEKK